MLKFVTKIALKSDKLICIVMYLVNCKHHIWWLYMHITDFPTQCTSSNGYSNQGQITLMLSSKCRTCNFKYQNFCSIRGKLLWCRHQNAEHAILNIKIFAGGHHLESPNSFLCSGYFLLPSFNALHHPKAPFNQYNLINSIIQC